MSSVTSLKLVTEFLRYNLMIVAFDNEKKRRVLNMFRCFFFLLHSNRYRWIESKHVCCRSKTTKFSGNGKKIHLRIELNHMLCDQSYLGGSYRFHFYWFYSFKRNKTKQNRKIIINQFYLPTSRRYSRNDIHFLYSI